MKRIVVSLFCLSLVLNSKAQTLKDFTYLKDRFHLESYLNFSAMLANIDNPAAPVNREAHKQSVPFIDLYYLQPNFNKGGLNRRIDYKLLPDIFWLFKQITEKDERKLYASQGSTISGGIIGWHYWTWNILASNQRCINLGFSISDYFIGAIYLDSAQSKIILHEPQGWQIGAGPTAGISQRLNNSFILLGSAAYVPSFLKPVNVSYAKYDDAYPKPHFMHANLTLLSKWGLFAEAQYVQLINKGNLPNSTRRLDLKLGFAFVL